MAARQVWPRRLLERCMGKGIWTVFALKDCMYVRARMGLKLAFLEDATLSMAIAALTSKPRKQLQEAVLVETQRLWQLTKEEKSIKDFCSWLRRRSPSPCWAQRDDKIATAQRRGAFESGSVAEHHNFSRRDSGSSQVPNQSHGEGALEQAHPTSEKPRNPFNASQTPSSSGEPRQGQKHGSRDAEKSGRPSPAWPGVLAEEEKDLASWVEWSLKRRFGLQRAAVQWQNHSDLILECEEWHQENSPSRFFSVEGTSRRTLCRYYLSPRDLGRFWVWLAVGHRWR